MLKNIALFALTALLLALTGCESSSNDKKDSDTPTVDSDLITDDLIPDEATDEAEPDDGDAAKPDDKDTATDDGPVVTDEDVTDETVTDEDGLVADDDAVSADEDEAVSDDLLDSETDNDAVTPVSGLIISEYIPGSASGTKALEIYNVSSTAIALGDCALLVYKDGSSTVSVTMDLSEIDLAAGSVYTVCHTNFSDKTHCDQLANPGFNGNDAIELTCGGVTLDVFGRIGEDPGATTGWGSGDITSYLYTLRRACGIVEGDTNGFDAFDPADEWIAYPADTIDGLGAHTTECGGTDEDTIVADEDTADTVMVIDEDAPAIDEDAVIVDEDTVVVDEDTLVVDEDTLIVDEDTALPAPAIEISQGVTTYANDGAPFDFGDAAIGAQTITRTFTITNNGNADLVISNFDLDDTLNFGVDISLTATTVTAGNSTTVELSFYTTVLGVKNTRFTISSNDPGNADFVLNLTGTGVPAEAIVAVEQDGTPYPNDGTAYDFGEARIAVDTVTREFTIRNTGTIDLHIAGIVLNDTVNFSLDDSLTDYTVAAGASTTVSVSFDPATEGLTTSYLTISSDDLNGDYIVNLSGTALPTPVFPLLLDNYDGTGDLTYATDGTWGVNAGNYEGRANGLTTPEHSYASYDLTQSIPGWTLDKARGNEWFGWLNMNREKNVDGWGADLFSMAMILAADNADFNESATKGYAVGFKSDGSLVVFRFDAGITDASTALPGTATELVNSGYVYANTDLGVNIYVELKNGGKWAIYYKKGAQLSDADAVDKMKYTDGTVTSAAADETYTGTAYKYAGWAYAHKTSANHVALMDNFGAGMTE